MICTCTGKGIDRCNACVYVISMKAGVTVSQVQDIIKHEKKVENVDAI